MKDAPIHALVRVALTLNVMFSSICHVVRVWLVSVEIRFQVAVKTYLVRKLWNHLRVATITKNYCNIPFKDYDPPQSPCSLSPCGINALCNERNSAGSCSCVPEFFGDPYVECRPECVTNSECPKSRSCVNNKCRDPCSSGTCGINAECRVFSHSPTCSCLEGYTGNPSSSCHIIPEIRKLHMQFSTFYCIQ